LEVKQQILAKTALEFLGRDPADFDWKTDSPINLVLGEDENEEGLEASNLTGAAEIPSDFPVDYN